MARDVTVTYMRNLQHEMRMGLHRLVVDEPKEAGGDDTGRAPTSCSWPPSGPEPR